MRDNFPNQMVIVLVRCNEARRRKAAPEITYQLRGVVAQQDRRHAHRAQSDQGRAK